MPARRRAPQGRRHSKLQISMSLFRMFNQPESQQQNVKLFLRRPLALVFVGCNLISMPADGRESRLRPPEELESNVEDTL